MMLTLRGKQKSAFCYWDYPSRSEGDHLLGVLQSGFRRQVGGGQDGMYGSFYESDGEVGPGWAIDLPLKDMEAQKEETSSKLHSKLGTAPRCHCSSLKGFQAKKRKKKQQPGVVLGHGWERA